MRVSSATAPFVERHVEVDPHQHPLAVEVVQVRSVSHSSFCDEVDDAVRVAPLVVVPGDDLDHRPVHHRGQLGVDDRGGRVPDDVRGDDRVLGVLEDALAAGPSAAAFSAALISSMVVSRSASTVRSTTLPVGTGARTAKPLSLPLSSGITSADRLGGPGGGRDQVDGRGARAAQVACAACPAGAGRPCRRGSSSSGRA